MMTDHQRALFVVATYWMGEGTGEGGLHLGLICGESADAVVGHGVQNIAHVRGHVHLLLVAGQDERMLQEFVVLGPQSFILHQATHANAQVILLIVKQPTYAMFKL